VGSFVCRYDGVLGIVIYEVSMLDHTGYKHIMRLGILRGYYWLSKECG